MTIGKVTPLQQKTIQKLEESCRAASQLEDCGRYDEAAEVLQHFWKGPGFRPVTRGLTEGQAAALLLRAGSLTAWLGSKRQVSGWQELAKDLLTESAAHAAIAKAREVWSQAQKHLATCYWREGGFNEARAILSAAIEVTPADGDTGLLLRINLALVEWSENHLDVGLSILNGLTLSDDSSRLVKALFHNGRAMLRKASKAVDEAIVDLTACCYYLEQIDHRPFLIGADINLGNLYVATKQYTRADRHLRRAEKLAEKEADLVHLAQAKDSRALALLAERRYAEAEKLARESVRLLERGDECALLVDSLVTHGRALARLKRHHETLGVFVRALQIAESKVSAQRAAQIGTEIVTYVAGSVCLDAGMSYDQLVDQYKQSLINAALDHGEVTEAALRLGMKHQTLSWLLNNTYPHLRRKPSRPRGINQRPASTKNPQR